MQIESILVADDVAHLDADVKNGYLARRGLTGSVLMFKVKVFQVIRCRIRSLLMQNLGEIGDILFVVKSKAVWDRHKNVCRYFCD